MSNKLYYKLGLEELVEPEVTTPVVELQGSQLEVEQLHHELQEDINRVDTLRADTDALEDVQAALEQALKGAMLDRNALVFAQKTIQMVDKRWGFGYATPSMESSDPSALIASMEDGIGQRLKDMGKALLEMLKRVWAKLKEWGNKFLQLLGLKKKKLETLVNKIVSHIHDAKTGSVATVTRHIKVIPNDLHLKILDNLKVDYERLTDLMVGNHFPTTRSDFTTIMTQLLSGSGQAALYYGLVRNMVAVLERTGLSDATRKNLLLDQVDYFNDLGFNVPAGHDSAAAESLSDKSIKTYGNVYPGEQCLYLAELQPKYDGTNGDQIRFELPSLRLGDTVHGRKLLDRGLLLSEKELKFPELDETLGLVEALKDFVQMNQKNFDTYQKEIKELFERLEKASAAAISANERQRQDLVQSLAQQYTSKQTPILLRFQKYIDSFIDNMSYYLSIATDYNVAKQLANVEAWNAMPK